MSQIPKLCIKIILIMGVFALIYIDKTNARHLQIAPNGQIHNAANYNGLPSISRDQLGPMVLNNGPLGDNQSSNLDDDDDDDDDMRRLLNSDGFKTEQQVTNSQVTDQIQLIPAASGDLRTSASHHKHHGHHAKGWLDMGAWTGKKGSFGWYDKHPVGKGK